MAMITFSGYPSSGKTRRAHELRDFFLAKLATSNTSPESSRLKVVLINDESLGLSKSAYDDSRSEKPARATLFSAVLRNLTKENLVIIDAMNYIKGSRYQMYCAAREASVRMCTVYIATPPDCCRSWNTSRNKESAYLEPTLENLISRFEEPSSSVRWDSPLITIPHFDPPLNETSGGLTSYPVTEAEQIWEAITIGELRPPNQATIAIPTSTTSYLTLLESTATALIQSLLSRQALSPLSGATTLTLPTTPPIKVTIALNKPVTMPMCQRLKRQFTKLNMQFKSEMTVENIAILFAEYLESQVR